MKDRLTGDGPGPATPAGKLGLATFQVGAMFFPIEELTDADPLDNTATIMLTAVE